MIIPILVYLFFLYLLVGLIVGLWFVFRGVNRVDEGMKPAGWWLRLLLLPASMALWPLLLKKYFRITKTKTA